MNQPQSSTRNLTVFGGSARLLTLACLGLAIGCSVDSASSEPIGAAGQGAQGGVSGTLNGGAGAGHGGSAAGSASIAGSAGSTSGGTSGSSGSAGNAGAGAGAGGVSSGGGTGGSAGSGEGGSAGTPAVYRPCPPPGTPCKILPLGDSITAGYKSTRDGGYRVQLLHDIWKAQREATFVGSNSGGPDQLDGKPFPKSNEGHSGYTIDDAPSLMRTGISGLTPGALTKYTPHIVTLMIGTNDIGTRNDLSNAPKRLAKLIDSIISTSPKALLVVAQITPTGDDSSNALTQTYNAAIADLVKSRAASGKHVVLVDMYSAFTAHTGYRTELMSDSLHPNDAGYALLGDTWYAALAPHW